jgi:hypothetical protein
LEKIPNLGHHFGVRDQLPVLLLGFGRQHLDLSHVYHPVHVLQREQRTLARESADGVWLRFLKNPNLE